MPLSDDAIAIIAAVRESTAELERKIVAMQARQDQIIKGFPGSDLEGHRRYHESIIEWRELRNRIVREALIKAAQAGAVGALGWIAYAVWTALKMEITK